MEKTVVIRISENDMIEYLQTKEPNISLTGYFEASGGKDQNTIVTYTYSDKEK